ncbi:MAG: tetratricopeptide repeat protein, partial [Caldilineaceae bacterium]|nr:tetratricopeptide repeat protein [Caldilineaceae bacterium]
IAEQARNRWFMAYCLHEMGNAARTLGAYAEAKQHYQAGYALREEFADPEGMAVALNHLGAVAVAQREYAEAERLYQRSLAIYRKIDDPGGLVTALDGLARTYCASGQVQMAIHPLAHALRIATTAHFVALRLALFVTIGQLLLQIGRQEQALELLTFAQLHPSASHETGARARRLLDQSASPPLTRAALHDRLDDLDKITAKLQLELATLDPSYAPPASITPRARLLVEPLTARELELLQLLAGGLSYQEIAGRLIIAVGTVKSHAHHIYAKLGVRNRVQALSKAIELDLLSR